MNWHDFALSDLGPVLERDIVEPGRVLDVAVPELREFLGDVVLRGEVVGECKAELDGAANHVERIPNADNRFANFLKRSGRQNCGDVCLIDPDIVTPVVFSPKSTHSECEAPRYAVIRCGSSQNSSDVFDVLA